MDEIEQPKAKPGPKPKLRPTDWEKRERRRADISDAQMNLNAEPRPGFVRRWVNDVHGRIERFRRMDYEPVINDAGEQVSVVAGKHTDGRRAVLMETRQDWFDEAQEQKQKAIQDPKTMKEAQAGKDEYIPGQRKSAVSDDKLR